MKNLVFLSLVLLACNACQQTPQSKFDEVGVSFICPKGWKITDKENLDDQGYFLSIEKEGLNSSGMITMSWVNAELELDEWIDIHKSEMKDNIIYKNAGLNFGAIRPGKFNGLITKSLPFKASFLGLKHDGIMHFFYEKERTFSILIQEAIEDKTKNKIGFEIIEESFKIKRGL